METRLIGFIVLFFQTLFIVVIQFHDRKHVFILYHTAQMLALRFDWGSGETFLQEHNSTGRRGGLEPRFLQIV